MVILMSALTLYCYTTKLQVTVWSDTKSSQFSDPKVIIELGFMLKASKNSR